MKAIDLFKKTIDRSEDMLGTHKMAFKTRPQQEGVAADILRSIIVFSLASFDAYFHKKIIEVVAKIIGIQKRIPEKIISIVISQISRQNSKEDDLIIVSRGLLEIAINKDPITKIKQLIGKGISRKTFQKSEDVSEAAKMMEIENVWKEINTFIAKNKKGPKKKGPRRKFNVFLDEFAKRRDMIVHESDTYSSKKYHGNLRKITRTEVEDGLKDLKKIVEAVEMISPKKSRKSAGK